MKENQQVEWKQIWRDDYLRWICGFANAEGGVLVIGRNDKGVAVGVKDAGKLMEEIPNKVRDILGIMVEVNLHEEAGKELGAALLEQENLGRFGLTAMHLPDDPEMCFRFGGLWFLGSGYLAVGIEGGMIAFVLSGFVEMPVLIKVTARPQGAEA